ncbi:YwgA family protein [Virgibacillus kekensis]|uniref:YwgA family protein n=1 Tax=Virgibacillus kekensis TaxID=202261 RepID=A0ABV9DJX9_9BACI
MLANHAKLIQFFAAASEVSGRKKMQKMIYILQKFRAPFEEKFQFHFYGPYSEELSLRIEELCNLGFIDEKKEDKSNYSQYHYGITEAGQDFLNQFKTNMPDITEQIELLNGKSARFLELVSTMLYFDHLPEAERVEKIHMVKPKQKFTDEEIGEALNFIKTMNPLQ